MDKVRKITSQEAFELISKYNIYFKEQWDKGTISPNNYVECIYYEDKGVGYINMYLKDNSKETYVLIKRD